ncbi:unnamed protein product (macronuclear) [Paramecium tetraurelia]|uniref:Uncharacterized protein n=1 Tax=Paramecium tetraurelia TaxID=5888 RepID=A0DZV5_PARTE|nr:uncharacterized protein GSPATT00021740001 [Paramecium tetraurelia]CAK88572.1 unnamed protein product [Paramecium tetraurelia]|eukprot:XP_001455969.1 hypothetical protein (macronuclear) [Paramecium tetraurelia strain d4-2]
MNMNQYQYDIEIVNTQIIFPNFRRLDMLDLLFENQHTQYNAPPKIRKKRFLATPSHLTLITLNLSDNCESLNEEVKHQSRMKLQPILIIRFLEQKLEELF